MGQRVGTWYLYWLVYRPTMTFSSRKSLCNVAGLKSWENNENVLILKPLRKKLSEPQILFDIMLERFCKYVHVTLYRLGASVINSLKCRRREMVDSFLCCMSMLPVADKQDVFATDIDAPRDEPDLNKVYRWCFQQLRERGSTASLGTCSKSVCSPDNNCCRIIPQPFECSARPITYLLMHCCTFELHAVWLYHNQQLQNHACQQAN